MNAYNLSDVDVMTAIWQYDANITGAYGSRRWRNALRREARRRRLPYVRQEKGKSLISQLEANGGVFPQAFEQWNGHRW